MFFHGVPITDPWSWGWAIAGTLISVMIICIFVRIIIRIVRGDCRRRRRCFCAEQAGACADARTILDERYAKGEIDDEEYKRKKENLR